MRCLLIGLTLAAVTMSVGQAQEKAGTSTAAAGQAATVAIVSPSMLETGANSFTEEQARARLEGAGLASISALEQDDRGIWRGRAVFAGAPVNVGFDYRGNISAQ